MNTNTVVEKESSDKEKVSKKIAINHKRTCADCPPTHINCQKPKEWLKS